MIKAIIADDHQMFIDGIQSILENVRDISVVAEAKNGLDLIKAVEKVLPDIVLTDIRMPVMDGIAATKYLGENCPQIPVLALSMFDQEEEIIEMLKAGASGYIIKKAGKEELVTAINKLVNRGNYYSPSISGKVNKWLENPDMVENQSPLTKREREILRLIANGKTSQQIAKRLKISKYTVDTHRKNIHKKLDIKTNTGLVKYMMENLQDS
ncbi:response regulator transcription factor [Rhodohalobacter sp. 614A]|uniref:response regulator transcription factor n=1 Tax=Rhodohalobacter sp. 614A TaxID=2908649 RepID=UPI001F3B8092|nr:response regulator transcription factor [Rhodohalobacter sp. 614A]